MFFILIFRLIYRLPLRNRIKGKRIKVEHNVELAYHTAHPRKPSILKVRRNVHCHIFFYSTSSILNVHLFLMGECMLCFCPPVVIMKVELFAIVFLCLAGMLHAEAKAQQLGESRYVLLVYSKDII